MTRQDLEKHGLTELDLDRAMWHLKNGTAEFREFLTGGAYDVELVFAKWLKENVKPGVSHP